MECMKTPKTAWNRARLAALMGAMALLAGACAEDAPLDFLNKQAGRGAEKADQLWDITFLVAVAVFFLVEGVLVFALYRFRHRPGREAAQFHGNTRVEILLTVIPALILAALAVPTIKTIFDLAENPPGALQVKVVGRQFWWEYQYSDLGFTTANELHIPVDKATRLTIEGAADDVIHSFSVPRLAGTQDVVPGRINFLTLEPTQEGEFFGQCKEYCGLSHANMRLRVIVDSEAEFEEWVAEQSEDAAAPREGSLAARGREIFLDPVEGQCLNCHAIQGTEAQATIAPDLTHFAARGTFAGALFEVNERNLARWLADPPAIKPGAKMPDYGLSQDEIEALVAYLMSLE
jgi:cytochrome c oxidase subunit II